jgi:hypothetical protein
VPQSEQAVFRSDTFFIAQFPALSDSSFIAAEARSSSSNRRGGDVSLGPNVCRWSQCATLSPEVARILATGLRRIQAQEASSLSAENRESSFDILALKRRVGRRKPTIRVGES